MSSSTASTATTVNSLLGTDVSAPSAEALPFILRQKLRRQLHRLGKSDPYASLALTAEKKVPAEDRPRLYTADELETQLQQVSAAIVSTQQQIQASEETYYEETYAHGSVFAGWDGFIDSREVGANLAAAAPQRRMPQDSRWFSSSSNNNNNNNNINNSQRQETPHLPVQLVEEGRPVTFQVEEAMVTEKAATTATAQSAAVEPPTDEAKNNDDETDEPNADDAMKMGPEDTTYNEKDAEKEEEAEEQAEKEQEDVKKDETKKDVKASKRKAAVTVEPTRTTRPKRAKRG